MEDLINRILWDKSLDPSEFFIVYEDRIFRNRKVRVSEIELKGFIVHGNFLIPLHRVREILWREVPIFKRSWANREKAVQMIEERFGVKCRKLEFQIVKTRKLPCPEGPKGNFEPVVILGGGVLNCSAYLAYVNSGSPLLPLYFCK